MRTFFSSGRSGQAEDRRDQGLKRDESNAALEHEVEAAAHRNKSRRDWKRYSHKVASIASARPADSAYSSSYTEVSLVPNPGDYVQ